MYAQTCLTAMFLTLATADMAVAQDLGSSEVIVTASRREGDGYSAQMPAGLRRRADFAIQQVTITGDTRERERRQEEIMPWCALPWSWRASMVCNWPMANWCSRP
jgi:phage-related protein